MKQSSSLYKAVVDYTSSCPAELYIALHLIRSLRLL